MVSLNEKRSKIRYVVQNKTEWVDGKSTSFIFIRIKIVNIKYFNTISFEIKSLKDDVKVRWPRIINIWLVCMKFIFKLKSL